MYLTFKALHLIAMVAWFAGLFYLPRLYVYHSQDHGPEAKAMLVTMERKLYRYIMTPAMMFTWAFGVGMVIINPDWLQGNGWLHAKLGLVGLLTLYHISLGYYRHRFVHQDCARGERFFRVYNEIPTLFLIAIVLLAVLRPF